MRKIKPEEVYIIIPVYNEQDKVIEVIKKLQSDFNYNIVSVNDGSKDQSLERLLSHPNIFVLNHILNRGQGAAIRTGQEFALYKGAKYIVHFDSDGQHSNSDIPKMLNELIDKNLDLVLGSRFMGEKHAEIPKNKKMILKLGIIFTWFLSGMKLTDTHNGFRVMNRKAAEVMLFNMDRYQHASEVYEILAANQDIKYSEFPVTIKYDSYSLSQGRGQKVSNSIHMGIDLLLSKLLKIFLK